MICSGEGRSDVCEHEDVCEGVCGGEAFDVGGGGDLGISGISEMVDSSVKRFCSATDVRPLGGITNTNRYIRQNTVLGWGVMDKLMITVRVWWLWHSNLILRCPENMEYQYNKKNTITTDEHGLNNPRTHTVDIECTILTAFKWKIER